MAGLTTVRARSQLGVPAALLAVALVAWLVTADRMAGMDAGPATDLGTPLWFVGAWTTMMAAMMLPSAAPVVALFGRTYGTRLTAPFAAGYLLVWVAFGIVAYALHEAVVALELGWLDFDRGGAYVAGAAIALAGLYEVTPLKDVCLRHCRSPIHVLMARWRPGDGGALRMGAEHGGWCAGCCAALMVALFALGVMSLFWMVAVALVILAEKVLPHPRAVTRVVAVVLVALGLAVAIVPDAVPLLGEPAPAPMSMDGM